MTRILPIAALLVMAGCLPSRVHAPAPVNFHSSRSAKEATQAAAVLLANAGFRVTQSDSVGNALTAMRTANYKGNEEYVVCELPNGSAAAANRETTLVLSIKVTAAATQGSDVGITSRVTTSYPGYQGTSMQVPANDTDCVSNGTIEQQLTNALR